MTLSSFAAALSFTLLAADVAWAEAWTLPDNVRVFHPADDSAGGNSHHPAAAIAWKTWVLTDESGLEKSLWPPANESGTQGAQGTQGTQGTQWLLSRRMLGTFLGLALILTVLWLLTLVQKWRDQVSPNEFALYVNLLICIQGFTNYSSVVLCSYPLFLALKSDDAASMSGLFIGIFMTASAAGTGVCWKILSMFPDVWRGGVKTFLVVGLSCQLAGALGLGKVAWVGKYPEADSTWVYLSMTARVFQGFGHGMNDQIMKCCIVKLAPISERPRHSLNKFVANTVGIGAGPILVAAAFFFFQDENDATMTARGAHISMLTAQLQFWTTGVLLTATMLIYPAMKEVATDHGAASGPAHGDQALVLIISLVMDALRAFIVSGVESATCLLLQEKFQWNHDSIGFCIGVTFCLVVPAYLLHRQFHHQFGEVRLMRAYTCMGITATMLLGFAMHPEWILLADSVIFPTTYLSGALNMGILNSNVFPDGSLLDANNVMLVNGLISNGMGRFGGPVFSRSLIAELGQKAYAACQACAMAFILCGTTGVGAHKEWHSVSK